MKHEARCTGRRVLQILVQNLSFEVVEKVLVEEFDQLRRHVKFERQIPHKLLREKALS